MNIINQQNIIISAFAIFAIMGIAITPNVSADSLNTPITAVIPPLNAPGGSTDLVLKGNPASGKDPHDVLLIRVHEPGVVAAIGDSTAAGTYADCSSTPERRISLVVAGDPQQWELRVKAGDPGTNDGEPFQIADLEGLEQVKVKFGTGLTVTPVVALNGGDGVTLSGTQLEWVNIHPTPTGADNLDMVGEYSWQACGTELAGAGNWNFDESIIVVEPVGGEIISVNTSALLIAGLTTSGLWIVPSLVTVTGIGLTVYKIRKNN